MISAEMIGVIMTAAGGILVGGIAWGRNGNVIDDIKKSLVDTRSHVDIKINEHVEDDLKIETEIKRQLQKQWDWQETHEKEAADMREKYQTQISEIRGAQLVVGEQFRQIMGALANISERLTDLERRRNSQT